MNLANVRMSQTPASSRYKADRQPVFYGMVLKEFKSTFGFVFRWYFSDCSVCLCGTAGREEKKEDEEQVAHSRVSDGRSESGAGC